MKIVIKTIALSLALVLMSCVDSSKQKALEEKLDKAILELDSVKNVQNQQQHKSTEAEQKLDAKIDSLGFLSQENDNWLINQYENLNSSVFLVYTSNDSSQATGTSFLVGADGVCVSNFHVFEGMKDGFVKNKEGRWFKIMEVVDYDKIEDYIIFKIDLDYNIAKPLAITKTKLPKVGEKCFAIGNPRGRENTLSEGIVSAIRNEGSQIQMTAEITYGSSGGPLFNKKGEVIGITSSGLGEANINYAININKLNLDKFINKEVTNSPVFLVEKLRSYFYNEPNLQSKSSIFIVSGDLVKVEKKENGFAYVSYTNQRTNTETKGWLSAKHITPVRKIRQDESRFYEVKNNRAYFFENANSNNKTGKFIIKNELISVSAEKQGYVYLVYRNANGKRTSGWINKSDLKSIGHGNSNKDSGLELNLSEKDRVETIKQRFQLINSNGTYEVVKREFGTDPNKGVILTGYFDESKLVKCRITSFSKKEKSVSEYYFWDEEVFFVFERYSDLGPSPESGKDDYPKTYENRFYLANNKLLRWLKNDGSPASAIELANMEEEFLADNKKMVNLVIDNL